MDTEIFSFFSGLGFLDLGFQNAGFDIVSVNEINPVFLDAYKFARRNDNREPKYGYSNIDIRELLDCSIWQQCFPRFIPNKLVGFIGGPPCPDFSAAGKNEGSTGKNGQLTDVFIQLIIKKKPDFFVFENVKGLYQTKKHREFYEEIKIKLQQAGYILFDSIENSLEYGVPQYRDRLILVGFRKETFGENISFVGGQHKSYKLSEVLNADWPFESNFNVDSVSDCPNNIPVELTVEHWFRKNCVTEHVNSNDYFEAKNIQRFMTIPEGRTSGKSFKRLHRWRYSPTAAYGNNEVHLHPYKPRRISVSEALSIQSLPADFELPDNICLSAKFKMIGNGVPYLLAYGVAQDIYTFLDQNFHKKG